jgi:hypothetical protein
MGRLRPKDTAARAIKHLPLIVETLVEYAGTSPYLF